MILDDARVLLPYWAEQVLFYYPTGQNRYCFITLLGRTGIVVLPYWAEQVLFYCPTVKQYMFHPVRQYNNTCSAQ
jgi:hypothetical protein